MAFIETIDQYSGIYVLYVEYNAKLSTNRIKNQRTNYTTMNNESKRTSTERSRLHVSDMSVNSRRGILSSLVYSAATI